MRAKYLPQDNEARINNGICFYDGRPYLLGLLSPTEASLSPIYRKRDPGEPIRIKTDDPKLDISAPTLGYINTNSGVIYLVRRPERRYKQTLQPSACWGYWPHVGSADTGEVQNALYSAAGEKMLLNDYPEFHSAIKTLGTKVDVALSKRVAIAKHPITKTWDVFLKNEIVGTLDIDTLTVKLVESELKWVVEKELSIFPWKLE